MSDQGESAPMGLPSGSAGVPACAAAASCGVSTNLFEDVENFTVRAASKVVRVGWYEDAYNITGKNGERSGYAYEYEQSVAAYTGWTYEYVKAGWSDLLQMMKAARST